MTSNSSATSYASAADMLNHYDLRVIADLISDVGSRVGGSPNPTPATVEADAKLAVALKSAAGMIEAAALRSRRYSPEDLATNLSGVSKEFLIQLNCDLAMGLLYRRRPDKGELPPFFTAAIQWLEQLANGESIFAFEETEAAGLPSDYVEQPSDVYTRDLVAVQAIRFFGQRGNLLQP